MHWLSKSPYRLLVVVVLLGALVAVGGVFPAPQARAASATATVINAVQLQVFTNTATHSVQVHGENQNGTVVTHCFNTPTTDNRFSGYYWKGQISLTGYTLSNCQGTPLCTVSKDIPFGNVGGWYMVDLTSC